MSNQFDVTSFSSAPPAPARPATPQVLADILQQMLDLQRQQFAHAQAVAAAQDSSARWRAMLGRLCEQFPHLPTNCREALPVLERAYGSIIVSMIDQLAEDGENALENEFAVQDFLDRYGMRLGQLGGILNLVTPLAEAAPAEPKST